MQISIKRNLTQKNEERKAMYEKLRILLTSCINSSLLPCIPTHVVYMAKHIKNKKLKFF